MSIKDNSNNRMRENEDMKKEHTFHIPVMGTAFSIDTPVKVAKYGISSVISLVDDTLIEHMRKFYCEKTGEKYTPITKYDEDHRARRITEYLNLVDRIVKKQFEELKNSAFELGSEITKYFELLPESSTLKKLYQTMMTTQNPDTKKALQDDLREKMIPGTIDVNIMTKLDRPNFAAKDKSPLPSEYSDALAALRGYAQSTLKSSIIFSAGINQRLYGYLSEFKDFYADATGFIKKKVVIKVSDFRSSIIQGKFFAKKGLWVSEYRIESGLNCGGHAFATNGFLMGPILEEFKNRKQELADSLHKVYQEALKLKNKIIPENPLKIRITAQGGIGTARENNFLLNFFKIDGTGWATPFLLVPEATNVDLRTIDQLSKAKEKDLYLSDVSPLGVPFNNLRNSQSDAEKMRKEHDGKPGSACPKGHLVSNTEFTERPICKASRQYQKLKIDQINEMDLDKNERERQTKDITKKACICHDLGEPALTKNNIPLNGQKERFTAICPGPNMAYFTKVSSLKDMVSHIYGRVNLLNGTYRPNMFVKELKMYIDYLIKDVQKAGEDLTARQIKYFNEFKSNLFDGVEYYRTLIPQMLEETESYRETAMADLERLTESLKEFVDSHANAFNETEAKTSPALI